MELKEFKDFVKTEKGKQLMKAYYREKGMNSGNYPADSYYKKFFFKLATLVTWVLFLLGLLGIVLIFVTTGDPFKAASLVFLLVWLVVFVRYFLWAVYHYNVNYGLSIKDWENIEEAKERFKNGETVLASELEEPKFNPYRSQTFGVPPGTVRGMLAFTLLFGAISILIASMGMEQVDLENSLIRDQFEFFKTAFLMMMAFYFGDKSLRFLQKRWRNPNANEDKIRYQNGGAEGGEVQVLGKQGKAPQFYNANSQTINNKQVRNSPSSQAMGGDIGVDDDFFLQQDQDFADVEGINTTFSTLTNIKDGLNAAQVAEATDDVMLQREKFGVLDEDIEDGHMMCSLPNTPIIDAGHGGIDENGEYTTGSKKRFKFIGEGQGDLEILEGVINRKIAQKLIRKLDEEGIAYHDLNSFQVEDMPLRERAKRVNDIYERDKSSYLLSIHSNAAFPGIKGKGSNAHGFEIWTSLGPTDSDEIAEIAKQSYLKFFRNKFRFRGLKQANFLVLKRTKCPAILVENLFFDNFNEAQYLLSDQGQEEIADCLVDVVKSVSCKYEA